MGIALPEENCATTEKIFFPVARTEAGPEVSVLAEAVVAGTNNAKAAMSTDRLIAIARFTKRGEPNSPEVYLVDLEMALLSPILI